MNTAIEKDTLPRMGAQFFINPDDTYEDTEKHFSLMKQYGIRLVRLFILWEHVEPKQGKWDFSRYDIVYDLAEKYQIKIVSTITAEDPPQWFEKKPFYHHYSNLNDTRLKQLASIYIQKLVSRYYHHPAHCAWILMNEPELYVNYEPSTLQAFHQWLKNKYHTIDSLNLKWYQQHSSFDEIKISPQNAQEYWQCFPTFIDWNNFLKDNLISQLEWIKSQIRIIDQTSPLHLNPKGFYGNLAPVGQDYWKENQVSDILGASIHPAWKFLWFDRNEYGLAFSFCVDIIKSASNGKSFWVTELQSGATLMTGIQPCTPSPDELSAWLWDGVGAGAKSIIYWMWHPRTFGQEAGEWGIVTVNHKISKRLIASHTVSKTLEQNAALFSKATPPKATVAILYNHATELLSLIEGSPLYRTPEATIQSLVGIYKALKQAQISVDFISEDQILEGKLDEYEYLYLPYSYALDLNLQVMIKDYVSQGGNLWAESPFGWKNSYGEILREQPLNSVFGFEVNEFQGRNVLSQNELPYLCQADLDITTAEMLSELPDGSPAITRNYYKNGIAVFVNTTASLGFFHRNNSNFAEQINFFVKNYTQEFQISTDSNTILHRILSNDNYRIMILENWGKESSCHITSQKKKFIGIETLYGRPLKLSDEQSINVTLQTNETIVLKLEVI